MHFSAIKQRQLGESKCYYKHENMYSIGIIYCLPPCRTITLLIINIIAAADCVVAKIALAVDVDVLVDAEVDDLAVGIAALADIAGFADTAAVAEVDILSPVPPVAVDPLVHSAVAASIHSLAGLDFLEANSPAAAAADTSFADRGNTAGWLAEDSGLQLRTSPSYSDG